MNWYIVIFVEGSKYKVDGPESNLALHQKTVRHSLPIRAIGASDQFFSEHVAERVCKKQKSSEFKRFRHKHVGLLRASKAAEQSWTAMLSSCSFPACTTYMIKHDARKNQQTLKCVHACVNVGGHLREPLCSLPLGQDCNMYVYI